MRPDTPDSASAGEAPGPRAEAPWTIGRLLAWTADYLKKRGAESPRLDAEVMLAHVLSYERVQLYTHFEDVVDEAARARFRDLVRRRAEGAPVAYLVGRKEFFSLRFDVAPAVLIPRPETEYVVLGFLEFAKEIEAPVAADVGTGSGCVAVACARRHAGARFTAIDLSPEALEVARKNAARHEVTDRVEFLQGDLLGPAAGRPPFDAIVSNPPYIPTGDIAGLDPGVRDYEPRLALDGGPDGLALVTRLVEQAIPLLKPGGRLILEIGSDQEEAVRRLFAERAEYQLLPTVRDLQGHPRVIHATRTP
ncbi:peptide chain release factor N(5)-glutamine methyltransferase [Paludisphaera mucosa]|uniref:Release factor glutamine methyltransferase n=1 Tax=Paludisphaera mucosa TaxID=3030827 RepID=A0ABT6FF69_9BACT|nr:peptide chain release factor N(5)-glutamine methyltransferase [Paludisphaera mucosa]MDG3006216.1 peptide chain release factor N(5)-glutamine methyltransferase [Paludisphaera mucosa]